MRKGKKFISAALGFALVFQSFAGIGPVAVAATGDVDINSTFTDANFRSYVILIQIKMARCQKKKLMR